MEPLLSIDGARSSGKMINIILAENGTLTEVPLSRFVTNISVKRATSLLEYIEKEYGIDKGNQVILRGEDGKQLEANMNLEEYFDKDRTIYVYNKMFYKQEVIADDFEVIGNLSLEKKYSESAMQFLPAMYESHLGVDMKTLLDADNSNKFDSLMASFSEIRTDLNALKDGTVKLKRQKDSESIAKKNLMNYYIEKKRKFDEILATMEGKIDAYQSHLNQFDEHIDKLQKTKISKVLQEEGKENLIEYFDITKITSSKVTYEKNQSKIKQKLQEIKTEIMQYDDQLRLMEENIPNQYQELQKLIQDQEILFVDYQDTNFQELKNMVERTNGRPTKLDLNEFSKRIRVEFDKLSPKLRKISSALDKIREVIENSMRENASKLKDFISDIANLQVIIRNKISNKLTVFSSLVEKHEKDMFNFEILEKFPLIYQKSLEEINRRYLFKKDYSTLLNILEAFADSENKTRQDFLGQYQQYLPKSFCPFLSKSFCQLNFENIRKVLNQDLGLELNDSGSFSGKSNNESADILKLLKNLNDNASSREGKIKELEDSIKSCQDENDKLREQIRLKGLTVNNLRKLLGVTGFQDKLDQLVNNAQISLESKLNNLNDKIESLKVKGVTPVSKGIKLIQNQSSNTQELETLKQKFLESDASLNQFKKDYAAIKESHDKLQELDKELQNQVEGKNSIIKDLQETVSSLEAEIAKTREQLNIGTKQYEEVESQVKELKNKILQLESEGKESMDQIENLKEELSQSNDKAESFHHMMAEMTKEMDTTKKELNDELTKLAQEKKSLMESITKNQQEINKLTEENKNLSKQLEEAKEKSVPKTENMEIDSLKEKNKDLEKKIKYLNEENKKYLKQIKEVRDEYQQVNKALEESANFEIKKEKDTKDELQTQLDTLLKENHELTEQNNALKEELTVEKNNLKKRQDEISTLDKILESRNHDIQELQLEVQKQMGSSMAHLANEMLGNFGEAAIDLYRTIIGKEGMDKLNAKEIDLTDLLAEVKRHIANHMVKTLEFAVGDVIVAVKVPGSDKEYQVLNALSLGGVNVFYVFKASKSHGLAIQAKIKALSNCDDTNLLKKYSDYNLIQADLEDIKTLTCIE